MPRTAIGTWTISAVFDVMLDLGKQYRAQDGMPYCLACYKTSFSTVCEV